MNRYPLWKYVLILAVLLAGLIYTLPNFFGEAPAVQASPLRTGIKADAALLARASDALKAANLNPDMLSLEGNSVKARFADTDTQLKAKDVLHTALGEDFVVALNLVSRSPQW
ncbi:MAG: protein translocase subunit SecD, partial [Gallionella sp.]